MGYAETQQAIIQAQLRHRRPVAVASVVLSAPSPIASSPRAASGRQRAMMASDASTRSAVREAVGVAGGGGADADLAAAVAAARGVHVAAEVEEIVAAAGLTMDDLRAPSRKREMVEVRRIVAAYLRRRGCSLPEIGRVLNRDHTTVLHLLQTTGRQEARCA